VIPSQYHDGETLVSPHEVAVIPRRITAEIGPQSAVRPPRYLLVDRSLEPSADQSLKIAAPQYQPAAAQGDRRLMLRVGLGLGAVYLVFLGGWIWATRFRSRPPGH
jgi:hypothetical protein